MPQIPPSKFLPEHAKDRDAGPAVADTCHDVGLVVTNVPIGSLKGYSRALRKHSAQHIDQLVASISTFGFVRPIVVDQDGTILDGHGMLAAAKEAGCTHVPVVGVSHLDEAGLRTLRIALNRLAEKSSWDPGLLSIEFGELCGLDSKLDLSFDLTVTGFSTPEIDGFAEDAATASSVDDNPLPGVEAPVSRLGDVFLLGGSRLICGDARLDLTYEELMDGERADMGIHDAPYDVKISGHVAKKGRHREFVMGSGELGEAFPAFLADFLRASSRVLVPGGYQYCFMDWRHMGEMLAAGTAAELDLKNLCVWNKGSGAMGSLYRSQHELIFVFKDRKGPGANNVHLGKFGRNRTNVWDYPGAASMRKELALHPTPKNLSMIVDAIRDVSPRNGIILDAFSGSGTTIVACEKVGRRARAVELDPRYVDVSVSRWEQWSGGVARHAQSGLTFAALKEERLRSAQLPKVRPVIRSRTRAAVR